MCKHFNKPRLVCGYYSYSVQTEEIFSSSSSFVGTTERMNKIKLVVAWLMLYVYNNDDDDDYNDNDHFNNEV